MSRPWMPLYVGDYLKKTSRLTTEGHGAYLLLIIDYWSAGAPPDDDTQLAAITRLSVDAWLRLRPAVESFFTIEAGRWRHARVEEEIADADAKYERRAKAGRSGGIASSKVKPKTSIAEPPVNQSQSQPQRVDEIEPERAEPKKLTEPQLIADSLYAIVGFKNILDVTPDWYGVPFRAISWVANGWPRGMIEATAKKIIERGGPLQSINYFEKAFANAYASLNAPVPQGKATERSHAAPGKNAVIAAADNLVAFVNGFDQPAPDLAIPDFLDRTSEVRSGAGAVVVRAVSQR